MFVQYLYFDVVIHRLVGCSFGFHSQFRWECSSMVFSPFFSNSHIVCFFHLCCIFVNFIHISLGLIYTVIVRIIDYSTGSTMMTCMPPKIWAHIRYQFAFLTPNKWQNGSPESIFIVRWFCCVYFVIFGHSPLFALECSVVWICRNCMKDKTI